MTESEFKAINVFFPSFESCWTSRRIFWLETYKSKYSGTSIQNSYYNE